MTFAAVTQIEPAELKQIAERLAEHFVRFYGAPSVDAARGVAQAEIAHMSDLCDEHTPNTLLTVARELMDTGGHEAIRVITQQDAELEALAVH